jgi:hypothetical protein
VGPTLGLAGVENLAPSGFDPRAVQHLASRNTDYAISAPKLLNMQVLFKLVTTRRIKRIGNSITVRLLISIALMMMMMMMI